MLVMILCEALISLWEIPNFRSKNFQIEAEDQKKAETYNKAVTKDGNPWRNYGELCYSFIACLLLKNQEHSFITYIDRVRLNNLL